MSKITLRTYKDGRGDLGQRYCVASLRVRIVRTWNVWIQLYTLGVERFPLYLRA